MLESPLTCLHHDVLSDGLVVCAHRSSYASTWLLYFSKPCEISCTLSTLDLITCVHNRSQPKWMHPHCTCFGSCRFFMGLTIIHSKVAQPHTNTELMTVQMKGVPSCCSIESILQRFGSWYDNLYSISLPFSLCLKAWPFVTTLCWVVPLTPTSLQKS